MKRLLAIMILVALSSGLAFADKAKSTDKTKSEKADKKEPETKMKAGAFKGLELRGIGPALTSGRIIDIAVDPKHPQIYYVATAAGGVWKTNNNGFTWSPIFDSQGSWSTGCVTIDPNNPLIVWVGSGENNSQRSVGYGDGVYKSVDGGKSWENVGLKSSEHIGKIVVDPRNSKVVYVAAQGPLWAAGGERGLYKTTDGGKTWIQTLSISENTGVSDIAMDPRNPDVLYAAAYQRRRHVWTVIDGGPESAIHKTTDAGVTWKKLEGGLPTEEMGRIGLALSPANPDVVFAIIEASGKAGGTFCSTDAGGSWEKRGDYFSGAPQYYQELFPDPLNVDRIYSMDTLMQVSEDGGRTFHKVAEKYKHIDNHVLWIDPANTDHLLNGNDGGIYETYDRGVNWAFKANLPVTQFYRVSVDNAAPFYNVYGGTQDNFTLGGPSRTATDHGIRNSDWFIVVGGDGFWSQIDPEDPNIIYAESQYGGLIRHDRKTGEKTDIQPQPGKGEPALRFNWDSPLMISPFSHTRVYFAANKLFRSDDRGDRWTAVSPDLTRQIDRNKLKVMGRVWSVDAVAKNASTSLYGNIVSLSESPLKEGLLYVGTDDGLIQVSEDGGTSWRKIDKFSDVPDTTYVSKLTASVKDADTVFAAFDNHKMGDFKPYLLKSTDRGKNWTSIAGDLPDRGTVYAVVQDSENADLLFAGTEFGLYFTIDGGKQWIQLSGGLPITAVKDIVIQKRENDLVLATFGRGFYILDDYTPLRLISEAMLNQESVLFSVKQAWMYIPQEPLGLPEKAFQGVSFFTAPNPPFGSVFTYYLKDELKTKKKTRLEEEKKTAKDGKDVFYPTWEQLQAEDREEEPAILLTVTDEGGNVVRRITGTASSGFNRVAWDLRYPAPDPTSLEVPDTSNPFNPPPEGPLAAPGTYKVSLAKRVDGKVMPLGDSQTFEATPLGAASLPAVDRKALLDFEKKTARLQRAVLGAVSVADEAQTRLDLIKKALDDTPNADPALGDQARALTVRLKDLQKALSGDPVVRKRNEPFPPSIADRVVAIIIGSWYATTAPTGTHQQAYQIAADEFAPVLEQLRTLVDVDLKSLQDKAETAGAPWTPGRIPHWTKE
jgi:photosystem II stability/assembly factor-like uncharacterized protein